MKFRWNENEVPVIELGQWVTLAIFFGAQLMIDNRNDVYTARIRSLVGKNIASEIKATGKSLREAIEELNYKVKRESTK